MENYIKIIVIGNHLRNNIRAYFVLSLLQYLISIQQSNRFLPCRMLSNNQMLSTQNENCCKH